MALAKNRTRTALSHGVGTCPGCQQHKLDTLETRAKESRQLYILTGAIQDARREAPKKGMFLMSVLYDTTYKRHASDIVCCQNEPGSLASDSHERERAAELEQANKAERFPPIRK